MSSADPPGGEEERPGQTVRYKRARFSTRLPASWLYTASHYWLAPAGEGLWRVGFTRFATRMLGELVEYGFEVQEGQPVVVGQAIGWVEGFKARSEVYCAVTGLFAGPNPALQKDVTLLDSDPYGGGWLYLARGTPEPNSVDVKGYMAILDATIDRMLEKNGERRESD